MNQAQMIQTRIQATMMIMKNNKTVFTNQGNIMKRILLLSAGLSILQSTHAATDHSKSKKTLLIGFAKEEGVGILNRALCSIATDYKEEYAHLVIEASDKTTREALLKKISKKEQLLSGTVTREQFEDIFHSLLDDELLMPKAYDAIPKPTFSFYSNISTQPAINGHVYAINESNKLFVLGDATTYNLCSAAISLIQKRNMLELIKRGRHDLVAKALAEEISGLRATLTFDVLNNTSTPTSSSSSSSSSSE